MDWNQKSALAALVYGVAVALYIWWCYSED